MPHLRHLPFSVSYRMGWTESEELRANCVQFLGVPRPGEDQIEFSQEAHGLVYVDGLLGDEGGQVVQDFSDLTGFVQLELTPPVVEFHRRQRLDEQSGTAGGLIVNQPRNPAFELRLQRHDVPSVPLGDDRLLEVFLVFGGGNDFLQGVHQSAVGNSLLAANPGELGAGAVPHLSPIVDAPPDLLAHVGARVDLPAQVGQVRELRPQVRENPPDLACAQERRAHVQHLLRRERHAFQRVLHQRPDVVGAAQRKVAPQIEQQASFFRFRLQPFRLFQVGYRTDGQRQLPADGERGVSREPFENLVKFEGGQCLFVQRSGIPHTLPVQYSLGPKIALPILTMVEPSSTATSKSSVMPMER